LGDITGYGNELLPIASVLLLFSSLRETLTLDASPGIESVVAGVCMFPSTDSGSTGTAFEETRVTNESSKVLCFEGVFA
jgi:hypothetical protein